MCWAFFVCLPREIINIVEVEQLKTVTLYREGVRYPNPNSPVKIWHWYVDKSRASEEFVVDRFNAERLLYPPHFPEYIQRNMPRHVFHEGVRTLLNSILI